MNPPPERATARNAAAWDRLARGGSGFARVASDAEVADPRAALDARGWLPADLAGRDVLCLAAGGGWQSILYAAAGANVTVLDLSAEMLRLDAREADRRGFRIRIERGDMTDLSRFAAASFDLVHQPVSTCYVPRVGPVFAAVAGVLRPGGLYISQHKQPASLQCVGPAAGGGYRLATDYFRDGRLPAPCESDARLGVREAGCAEYLHRWEELVGGLCRRGFVVEDLAEPHHADPRSPPGTFGHRARVLPPYVRIKARRVAWDADRGGLWVPTNS